MLQNLPWDKIRRYLRIGFAALVEVKLTHPEILPAWLIAPVGAIVIVVEAVRFVQCREAKADPGGPADISTEQ